MNVLRTSVRLKEKYGGVPILNIYMRCLTSYTMTLLILLISEPPTV